MATYTFDGANKIIQVSHDGPVTTANAQDVYSRWKDWVLSDEANWDPAFGQSVGGEPLDASSSLDGFFFLRNDLGWRIRPGEADHELVMDGNLFGSDPLTTVWEATVGDYNVQTRLVLSSKALAVETGVSGLTPTEAANLALVLSLMQSGRKVAEDGSGDVVVTLPNGDTYTTSGWQDFDGTTPHSGDVIRRTDPLPTTPDP